MSIAFLRCAGPIFRKPSTLCKGLAKLTSPSSSSSSLLHAGQNFHTSRLIESEQESKFSISIVEHPYPINGKPLDIGKPPIDDINAPPTVFAVIALSGTQYKITKDDTIVADHMEGKDIGDCLYIDDVLLVGSRSATVVGRPVVPGAQVVLEIEELTKDKKVITLKVRRKKNSKNIKGFRADVTVLRCKDIIMGKETSADIGF